MGSKKNRRSQVDNNKSADPFSVRWLEKYDKTISKIWNKIPKNIGKFLATLITFMLGISISGDWLSILVHAGRQFGYILPENISNNSKEWSDMTLEDFHLTGLGSYVFFSCFASYSLYFGMGGFLHWYYYVRQRDRAEEWKCQPKKWLSPELERHEIILGSMTLFVNSTIGGILACYVANGGYSYIYYEITDYGWWWFLLQIPVVYIYMDYATYWIHRIYHLPFLYKHFHKLHHKYKQPTAFSVTAIHPIEAAHIQLLLITPIFLFPVHWLPFYCIVIYNYYHGIIDHSGITFKAQWWQPWQPDAIFHDNHHQYFHVNFGFNMELWDYLHGTYRKKDRVYTEDIFYGQGKSVKEVSETELQADLEERKSENPLAYRGNKNENDLSKRDIKRLKGKLIQRT